MPLALWYDLHLHCTCASRCGPQWLHGMAMDTTQQPLTQFMLITPPYTAKPDL